MKYSMPVVLFSLWLLAPAVAFAQQGVLTLDAFSFISFADRTVLSLPAGSTLAFDFGKLQSDGSLPFTIAPANVSIGDIRLSSVSGVLRYSLAGTAKGLARPTATGIEVDFSAPITATLVRNGTTASAHYTIQFTTESASATSVTGVQSVNVTGLRVSGPNQVQLVGAVTNLANAIPEPGSPVYAVLSGTFDLFPKLK